METPDIKAHVAACLLEGTNAEFLTEDEAKQVVKAMIRGLKPQNRHQFTDAEASSVRDWIHHVKIRATVLEMVLNDAVDIIPSPDGDPKQVRFADNISGPKSHPKMIDT